MLKTRICPRAHLQHSRQHSTFAISALGAEKRGINSFIGLDTPCHLAEIADGTPIARAAPTKCFGRSFSALVLHTAWASGSCFLPQRRGALVMTLINHWKAGRTKNTLRRGGVCTGLLQGQSGRERSQRGVHGAGG